VANWVVVERLGDLLRPAPPRAVGDGFSWLAARPTVASVIAGATRPEQVEVNVQAASWTLSAEELATVDRITRPG